MSRGAIAHQGRLLAFSPSVTCLLDLVHRRIRSREYSFDVTFAGPRGDYTDARPRVFERLQAGREATRSQPLQPIAYCHATRIVRLGSGRPEHDELVAAIAGDKIAVAHSSEQRLSNRNQETVADIVPMRVVDGFEFIQIDKRHMNGRTGAIGRPDIRQRLDYDMASDYDDSQMRSNSSTEGGICRRAAFARAWKAECLVFLTGINPHRFSLTRAREAALSINSIARPSATSMR